MITVLDVLRTQISESAEFMNLLESCLTVCSKAILQSKAYDHLRHIELVSMYLKEISKFWSLDTTEAKALVTQCFLRIVNGCIGQEPEQAMVADNNVASRTQKICDKSYLQMLMRNSGILETIVDELMKSTQTYENEILSYKTSLPDIEISSEDSHDTVNDSVSISISSQKIKSIERLCDLMIRLCLELSREIDNATAFNQLNTSDCILSFINTIYQIDKTKILDLVELLWNCLEVHYKYTIPAMLNDDDDLGVVKSIIDVESAAHILMDIFVRLANEGYRRVDKETRNNLLVMIAIIAKFPGAREIIVKANVLPTLITFGGAGDLDVSSWDGYNSRCSLRNVVSLSDVDLELKRLLWLLVGDLMRSRDEDAYHSVSLSPFMSVLLLYLETDSNEAEPTNGKTQLRQSSRSQRELESSSEYRDEGTTVDTSNLPTLKSTAPRSLLGTLSKTVLRELQVVGACILSEHAVFMMDAFISLNGPVRLILLLDKYADSSTLEHRNLVYYTLHTLMCASSRSEVCRTCLCTSDAFQRLISQLRSNEDESIRTLTARLISILCDGQMISQSLFKELGGIDVLVSVIAKYAEVRKPMVGRSAEVLKTSGLMPNSPAKDAGCGEENTFIVAIIGCIRASVLYSGENERYFAQIEGIDILLDVLEVSPFLYQFQLLRLISDLCMNRALSPFFKCWRSAKTMRYAAKLLIDCWLDEEIRLGVKREDGVLMNIMSPLGPQKWATVEATSGLELQEESSASRSFLSSRVTTAVMNNRTLASGPGSIPASYLEEFQHRDLRCLIATALVQLYAGDPKVAMSTTSELDLQHTQTLETDVSLVSSSTSTEAFKEAVHSFNRGYGLSPIDYQVLAFSWDYIELRRGRGWYAAYEELTGDKIGMCEADSNIIESAREGYFAAARRVQLEQAKWRNIKIGFINEQSESFTAKIIEQKNAEIKSEWIKKNARLIRTVPKRAKAGMSARRTSEGNAVHRETM